MEAELVQVEAEAAIDVANVDANGVDAEEGIRRSCVRHIHGRNYRANHGVKADFAACQQRRSAAATAHGSATRFNEARQKEVWIQSRPG